MTTRVVFIAILLVAALLRFWQLGQYPSLYWDEPAIGYNAYSILTTGRDEYGNFLPLTFRSFDDYKAPGYIYLTVPSVAIFGLTEFAVRFPSAFLGVLTVALVYFLTKALLNLGKNISTPSALRSAPLLAMASLTISPWHIHVSRIGFEANAAVFFLVLGIFLFTKSLLASQGETLRGYGVGGSSLLLIASLLSLVAAMYIYHSSRLSVPLLLLVYLIFFWKKFNKQVLVKSVLVALVLSVPLIFVMLRPETQNRVIWSSLFSYQRPLAEINRLAQIDQTKKDSVSFNLLHSEQEYFAKGFLSRFTNHLSPIFLFLKGDDNPRLGFGTVGIYYLFELPFFILGLIFLTKHKTLAVILLPWFLLGILPAALTRDQANLLRSLNAYVAGNIIIGLGAAGFFQWLAPIKSGLAAKKVLIKSVIFIPITGFIFWNVGFFLDNYFVHYAPQTAPYWQYGYKQVVAKVLALPDKYDKIYVSTDYGQPYIYFLFYQKYPPAKYQPQARLNKDPNSVDVGEGAGFDKFEFRKLYWPADRGLAKSLFVGSPEQLPEKDIDLKQARILDRVFFPNGLEAFRIVETL